MFKILSKIMTKPKNKKILHFNCKEFKMIKYY